MNLKKNILLVSIIGIILFCQLNITGYAFEVIPEEKNAEIGLFKYSSENDWGVIPAISQFDSVKNEKSNKSGSADNLIKSSLRSAGGETEGIKYQETYNDVNWSIDVYGNLYITGKGEFKPQNPDDGRFYYAPWHKYADEIVNAVVELEDTTDFSQMFYECYYLKSVRFVNKKTLRVKNMQGTFADCQNLQMIYWGPIDTSEVKNMNATFANCFNLIDLDLTSFDTCKVEDMTLLFNGCTSLSGLKWSNKFVTDNVKQAIRMFTYCWNLKELDLYQFKLSNVKTGGLMNMLWGCNKLQRIHTPSVMGTEEIDLFLEDSLGNVFEWQTEGTYNTINSIPAFSHANTCVKKCKNDYWDAFENRRDIFLNISPYYYVTDDDYYRLLSKLSPSDINSLVGRNPARLYYPSRYEGISNELWHGSCQGMSAWVALQNNGWVTLPSQLKGTNLNYDILSKINYYHVQQYLNCIVNSDEEFRHYSKAERITKLIDAFNKDSQPLVAYRWETSTDSNEVIRKAHTVCGLAIRYVDMYETTEDGKDVSNYQYCIIVYDPDVEGVTRNSDANIYFNGDGSFYIPYKDLKNDNNDINRIINVYDSKQYVDTINYYSGEPSSVVSSVSNTTTSFVRLHTGKTYNIRWNGESMLLDKSGNCISTCDDVDIKPEICDNDEEVNIVTIALPLANDDVVISSEEGFDVCMIGTYYTSYACVDAAGEIRLENNGNIKISASEEVNKTISIGINDGVINNPWNYIYIYSNKGDEIEINMEDSKCLIYGNNLSDTIVELSNEFREKPEPITLPENTTRAEFTKGEYGIIVKHNGDILDDGHSVLDGYNISFEVNDNWNGGYNAKIKIENTSEEDIDNWTLSFDYDGEISNVWNAEILSHDGNRYTIKNVGWNQDIAPGQTIEIGLSGQENFVAEPTDYALISGLNEGNTNDFSVSIQIYDDWGSGCNGNMTITNNSDTTIEDWVLEFDFDAELTSIWNAEIVSHEGAHYIIKNAQHNSNIEPGQSVSVGFNGGEGAGSTELRGYKLYSYGL